ncbi:hypothetical protein BH18ACT9_BH18ACT9_07670 [soil metagenome]
MSSNDAVGATREALTTLAAAVLRVRTEYGDTLGVRRLTSDIDRLQADLDELGVAKAGHTAQVSKEDLLEIPDDPYDESMWHDAQSEAQHAL